MDDESTHADESQRALPVEAGAERAASTEFYETDDGVVFYDAQNPLAWIQATETVTLADAT